METVSILITGGVGVISSTISALVSWFLTKRKYNSEVDSTVIENLQKSLDFYKILVDDNKERLDEVLRRNEALESEINDLRKQMFNVMSNICYNMTCTHRQMINTDQEDETKTDKEI